MSCITEILKIKGDKKFLPIKRDNETTYGVVVEGGGHYKGYEYLITFNEHGFRCGYVAIPETHAYLKEKRRDEYDHDLAVHGGVTFFDSPHFANLILGHTCTDKWIGFDCGHAYDAWDLKTALKYFADAPVIVAQINSIKEIKERVASEMEQDHPGYIARMQDKKNKWRDIRRTKKYVENECIALIEQLILKAA